MKGYANADLLVTPRELSTILSGNSGSRPLILDLRPPEAYAAGHIEGALHLDLWGLSLTDTDPAPLKAFMWMIEHVLAIHGVASTTPVVLYDEQSGIRSARAFWFLEYFGHTSVRVLDGGFGAWAREGLPVSRDASPPPKSEWTGTREASTIATWRDVLDALPEQAGSTQDVTTDGSGKRDVTIDGSQKRDVVILDARSQGEHCGTTVRAARGGSIPGAVNIEWTQNLTPQGDFKPAAELKAMYEAAGVTPDREVITYCQGGYRAAHSYLALRLLGYPRVRNYVGSWKEWGDRQDLPISTPAER